MPVSRNDKIFERWVRDPESSVLTSPAPSARTSFEAMSRRAASLSLPLLLTTLVGSTPVAAHGDQHDGISARGRSTPQEHGALGEPSDDTKALQHWLDAGGGLLPRGAYLHSETLNAPAGSCIIGEGPSSRLKMRRPMGAPAANGIITERSAITKRQGLLFADFYYDHDGARLSQPLRQNHNPIFGIAICIRTSGAHIRNVDGANSWDGFITAIDFDEHSEMPGGVSGMPRNVHIDGCFTTNCGCGEHDVRGYSTIPGKVGFAVGNSSGTFVVISNCYDFASFGAYGTDTGGAAETLFVNCSSQVCKADPRNSRRFYPGSGTPFVEQGDNSQYVSCKAAWPAAYGFENADGRKTTFSLCGCSGASFSSVRDLGRGRWSECIFSNASQAGVGLYDGISVYENSVDLTSDGPSFLGVESTSSDGRQRFGYSEVAKAGHNIKSRIFGGIYEGRSGSIGSLSSLSTAIVPGAMMMLGPLPSTPKGLTPGCLWRDGHTVQIV